VDPALTPSVGGPGSQDAARAIRVLVAIAELDAAHLKFDENNLTRATDLARSAVIDTMTSLVEEGAIDATSARSA
jgi:DNA-binding IclR family transcriptional regulator